MSWPTTPDLILRGNEPLLLCPEGAVWLVLEGSMAVFSVELQGGEPWGARAHLFNVPAGQVLFGLGAEARDGRAVLAVPLGEAKLCLSGTSDVRAWTRSEPDLARRVLVGWREGWGSALDLDAPEGSAPATEPGALAQLLDEQPAFHRWVLRSLDRKAETDRREEEERLAAEEQEARDSGRMARHKLQAVLSDTVKAAPPPAGDDLYRAAYLVAQHVGIELKQPSRSSERRARDPIEALARASRVRSRPVMLSGDWWLSDCGPLLAFRRGEGNAVALLPLGRGYELIEPASDVRTPVDAKVAATLEREAASFYRPFPDRALGALDLVQFALRGRGRDLASILLIGILGTLLSMIVPVGTGLLVDDIIPGADRELLWQLFLALLAATFGRVLFDLASAILTLRVETQADAETQAAVWDRVLRLRATFFRRFSTGDLQTRVTTIGRIHQELSGATLQSLLAGVLALLNFGLLLYYSPILAVVALFMGLLIACLAAASYLVMVRYERQLEDLNGELLSGVVELVQGVQKLRIAAAEERAFLYWADKYSRKQSLVLARQRLQDGLSVANLWIGMASVVLLFWFSVHGLGGLRMSAGSFLAFYVAYGAFMRGLGSLSDLLPSLLTVRVLEERAKPILEAQPESDGTKADPGVLEGRLEVERVSFRYDADGQQVLQDVSLSAAPGEMVALVGPSGSGKSTLLRLLLGFETPSSGTVRMDGQDVRGLDMQAVRRQLGVVLQNGRLNAGSLHECISAGAKVSGEEVRAAVRMAGLEPDVAAMPMGLHTVVNEGGRNLSGGQRQRVLIARALAQSPRLLLFDEATSYLDNHTQALVTDSLESLDVTRVVVAHRLSTIRNADRIVVLEKGRVVQEGTFDELLAEEGALFARLMRRQLA